jgi:hypothetical protein
MRDTGYKLLGMLMWRTARWHLRRIALSKRILVGSGLVALLMVLAFAALVRRAAA